jgi:hypothetical protein
MIFCARATRGRGLPSLDARSGRSISPHPWRENEQAWREREHRSMRAVKNSLPTLSGAVGESAGPRPGKWHVPGNRLRSNRRVGWVKISASGWAGEKSDLFEHPTGTFSSYRRRAHHRSPSVPKLFSRNLLTARHPIGRYRGNSDSILSKDVYARSFTDKMGVATGQEMARAGSFQMMPRSSPGA